MDKNWEIFSNTGFGETTYHFSLWHWQSIYFHFLIRLIVSFEIIIPWYVGIAIFDVMCLIHKLLLIIILTRTVIAELFLYHNLHFHSFISFFMKTCEIIWMLSTVFFFRSNIPVDENGFSKISAGELVCPYLPPIPPRGSGYHRYVFVLYHHDDPISFSAESRQDKYVRQAEKSNQNCTT